MEKNVTCRTVRIGLSYYHQIKGEAKINRRSVKAQIEEYLDMAFSHKARLDAVAAGKTQFDPQYMGGQR
jgi:hypothetical protein